MKTHITCDHIMVEERESEGCIKCGAWSWAENKKIEHDILMFGAAIRRDGKHVPLDDVYLKAVQADMEKEGPPVYPWGQEYDP